MNPPKLPLIQSAMHCLNPEFVRLVSKPEPGRTPDQNAQSINDTFGPVIYAYTRKQALVDGSQVDVTKTAQEAGIKYPLFLTRGVWSLCVAIPPDVHCQDEAGRLWDVVWMTRFAIIRAKPGVERLPVALYVRNDNQRSRLVKLVAECGPVDMDDPRPAITVMLPDED